MAKKRKPDNEQPGGESGKKPPNSTTKQLLGFYRGYKIGYLSGWDALARQIRNGNLN